jgi:hypothetical protein
MSGVRYNRKSAPKVKNGRVQKKNNHQLTVRRGFVIHRYSPRKGFRHLVTKQDVLDFIELIPDHDQHLRGVREIRLSEGDDRADGYYQGFGRERSGVIQIEAWRKELFIDISETYFDAHRSIFDRVGLVFERQKPGWVTCWFDERKAKAFILVHVFIHELGHHLDFVARRDISSGEPFAEEFANRLENQVWPAYVKRFGQP